MHSAGTREPVVRRTLSARLVMQVHDSPRAMLQVAASGFADEQRDETLRVTCDGETIAVEEVETAAGSRVHVFDTRPGLITAEYAATVRGRGGLDAPTTADEITYLRPSRYAESDQLGAFAHDSFGYLSEPSERVAAVTRWVRENVDYVLGTSRPTDGAVHTMLARQGVCRDFAHLVIALLRALDIPARFAAVYAPGLSPMDFHAVAEVAVDGAWQIVDATGLAPRSSLLRIATGRDSADTAFLSVYGGAVDLLETAVGAFIDGPLPCDDGVSTVHLT